MPIHHPTNYSQTINFQNYRKTIFSEGRKLDTTSNCFYQLVSFGWEEEGSDGFFDAHSAQTSLIKQLYFPEIGDNDLREIYIYILYEFISRYYFLKGLYFSKNKNYYFFQN